MHMIVMMKNGLPLALELSDAVLRVGHGCTQGVNSVARQRVKHAVSRACDGHVGRRVVHGDEQRGLRGGIGIVGDCQNDGIGSRRTRGCGENVNRICLGVVR